MTAAVILGPIVICLILNLIFPYPHERLDIPYSIRITDRDGQLLQTYLASDDAWRFEVRLDEISPALLKVVVFYEDRWFYWHPGVDLWAVFRAAVQNIIHRQLISGASTIPMQVDRILEPKPRTMLSKIVEMFRALQLEQMLSKDEILELYLNTAPYGGNIYGIEAASLHYFNKSAGELTMAEAAVLAAIPQNPNGLRPDRHPGRLVRGRDKILKRLKESDLMTQAEYEEALLEAVTMQRYCMPADNPQLGATILRKYPGQNRYHSAVDSDVQKLAENAVTAHREKTWSFGVFNTAVLVADALSSEVLAYVGTADWKDTKHGGQIDGIQIPRSPGSTLKPFAYAWAMDAGQITPASVLKDIPVSFSGYSPDNYDGRFSGLVSVQDALKNSLNVPAVHVVSELGLDQFLKQLNTAGVRSLNQPAAHYGLALVLGSGAVTLYELVQLYSAFPNEGRIAPVSLLLDNSAATESRVMSRSAAYMISEILKDVDRPDLPLTWEAVEGMPRVAWKTGTSFGRRDAWAVGFTGRYVVGVWMGNHDYRSVPMLTGAEMTGPLLFSIISRLPDVEQDQWLLKPQNLLERTVCALSGLPPSPACPETRSDFYIPGVSPVEICPFHRQIQVDTVLNAEVCSGCRIPGRWKYQSVLKLPPDVLPWLEGYSGPSSELPHNPSCTRTRSGYAPVILHPENGAQYVTSPNILPELQKINFSAAVSEDADSVFWYIDGQLTVKLAARQDYFWLSSPGMHEIKCMDDRGRFSKVGIRVK